MRVTYHFVTTRAVLMDAAAVWPGEQARAAGRCRNVRGPAVWCNGSTGVNRWRERGATLTMRQQPPSALCGEVVDVDIDRTSGSHDTRVSQT
jgi:hypothetical protein